MLFLNIAMGVVILSGSPGDTITYHGQGSPGSTVNLEVTASTSVSVNGDNYSDGLTGLNIPSGENRLSLTVSPVETMNVSGNPAWLAGDTVTRPGSVSGNRGTYNITNAPAGSYDVRISGRPAAGATSVSVTVSVSQPVSVGSDGTYTASIDTSGLPAGVYTVNQDGQHVADAYLGVTPPVTATPNPPTATPQPTPAVTVGPTANPAPNNESTIGPVETVMPTPGGQPTTASLSPTAATNTSIDNGLVKTESGGLDPGTIAIIGIAFLAILGAAYMVLGRRKKR